MKIIYKITIPDMQVFHEHLFKNTPALKLQRNIGLISIFITGPCILYLTHSLILSIVAVVVLFSLVKTVRAYSTKQLISTRIKNNSSLLEEVTFEMMIDGISIKTLHNDIVHKWTALHSIESTNAYIYIYFDPLQAIIIPKRCFESPDDAIKFFNEMKKNLTTHSN